MDDAIFFNELDAIQKKADETAADDRQRAMSAPPESDTTGEALALLEKISRDLAHAIALLHPRSIHQSHAPSATESVFVPMPRSAPVGTVIEGTFDGSGMLGNDGARYPMAPNYASKSKLVEGDAMKLTITPEGSFIYKQVRPVERRRVLGTLAFDPATRRYSATAEGRSWNVLTASITYYKGMAGDEVVVLVPKDGSSMWAAVDHVIKKF